MTPERFQQIAEIFREASSLEAPERALYLDDACGGDAEMRAEVERMLDADGDLPSAGLALDETSASPEYVPHDAPSTPDRIGRYTIKSVLGSGGMGTVYLAVQEQPRRRVALKVMKSGVASRSALRRFEFESQILGRLRHTGIAQVYEAGTHDDGSGGVPYFAMEYIAGAKEITEYAQVKKLGTRERLELFGRVCDAVHHGHQKGIIHRDLKPSNILVDSSGQPKIIDFGVARATDSDMAVTTLQTDVGQLIGTLQYMSPEQCEADPDDLDTRSDVYALGVILYELLCEKLPYDLSRAAVHEAARMIREDAPAKPSTINRTLRGDIETITLKALEKDRERRYRSAVELADDIGRYLRSEPIVARRASAMYVMRTFAKRHTAVFVTMVTLMVAVPGLIVATVVAVEAARHARAAEGDLVAERDSAEFQAYIATIALAQIAMDAGDLVVSRGHLDSAPVRHRSWEWRLMRRMTDSSHIALCGDASGVTSVALSPDDTLLVYGSGDGAVRIWDVGSGTETAVLLGHDKPVMCLAFSPDGSRVVSGSIDSTVKLWDVRDGSEIGTLTEHRLFVSDVAFSNDGARLASCAVDGTVNLRDMATGEVMVLRGHGDKAVTGVAFSPDGKRLASGASDGTIKIWDVARGSEFASLIGPEAGIQSVAFSPDGSRLASGAFDGMITVWDAETRLRIQTLRGHERAVPSVAFSPDGALLASGSIDHTIRVWSAATGSEITTLRGHEDSVLSVAFNATGTQLISGSRDRTIRMWDVAAGSGNSTLRAPSVGHLAPERVVFSSDGTRFAVGTGGGSIAVFDASLGREVASLRRGSDFTVDSLGFSSDGEWIVARSTDGVVTTWNLADGSVVAAFQTDPLATVALAPEGAGLAVGLPTESKITVLNFTGTKVLTLRGAESSTDRIEYSPDGGRLAARSVEGTIAVWDVASGAQIASLPGEEDAAGEFAFSSDGTRVASGLLSGEILVWDVGEGSLIATLRGHERGIWDVELSSDGSRLVSRAADRSIRTWDVAGGYEIEGLRLVAGTVDLATVEISPDGSRLAAATDDGSVDLWDVERGVVVTTLRGHSSKVGCLAFSPDGAFLVSGSALGMIKLWRGGFE